MNANLAPTVSSTSHGPTELRTMLAVSGSLIGLTIILFWPHTAHAQSSSCRSSYTVRTGDTINGVSRPVHSTSAGSIRACNNLPSDTVNDVGNSCRFQGKKVNHPTAEAATTVVALVVAPMGDPAVELAMCIPKKRERAGKR